MPNFIYRIDAYVVLMLLCIAIEMYVSKKVDKKAKSIKDCKNMFFTITIGFMLIILFQVLTDFPALNALKLATYSLLKLVTNVYMYYLFCYNYHSTDEKNEMPDKVKRILLFSTILLALVLIFNFYTKLLFDIGANGKIVVYPWYYVFIIAKNLVYPLISFMDLRKINKNASKISKYAATVTYIINTIATISEVFVPNFLHIWSLIACNTTIIYAFSTLKYVTRDSETQLFNLKYMENFLKRQDTIGVNYSLIALSLDNTDAMKREKNFVQLELMTKKFVNTLKRAIEKYKDTVIFQYKSNTFIIYVPLEKEEEIEELLLILDSNIKNENMDIGTNDNITYTYAYDIKKNGKFTSYLHFIRHILYLMFKARREQETI